MAVQAVGLAPFSAYARESSRAEASQTPVRARVVTTEAGIRLGKFGITYSSRDIELLPDQSSSSSSTAPGRGFSRSESFASILEGATLQSRMLDASTVSSRASGDASPTATRPYAAGAYAAVSRAGATAYRPRTLLATV